MWEYILLAATVVSIAIVTMIHKSGLYPDQRTKDNENYGRVIDNTHTLPVTCLYTSQQPTNTQLSRSKYNESTNQVSNREKQNEYETNFPALNAKSQKKIHVTSTKMNYSSYAKKNNVPKQTNNIKTVIAPKLVKYDRSYGSYSEDEYEEPQEDKRYYGEFKCKNCHRYWESAYAFLNKAQQCIKCAVWVYPSGFYKLEHHDGNNDTNKHHDSSRCQRCKERGVSCSSY